MAHARRYEKPRLFWLDQQLDQVPHYDKPTARTCNWSLTDQSLAGTNLHSAYRLYFYQPRSHVAYSRSLHCGNGVYPCIAEDRL